MFQMNEDARNKINYFLDNFSSEIITDFISLLQAKTITLSSDSYELIDKLHISSSDTIHVEQILKKFKSVDTLIVALTLSTSALSLLFIFFVPASRMLCLAILEVKRSSILLIGIFGVIAIMSFFRIYLFGVVTQKSLALLRTDIGSFK